MFVSGRRFNVDINDEIREFIDKYSKRQDIFDTTKKFCLQEEDNILIAIYQIINVGDDISYDYLIKDDLTIDDECQILGTIEHDLRRFEYKDDRIHKPNNQIN